MSTSTDEQFLLDTNVPSELIRIGPEPRVTTWINSIESGRLYFSGVSIFYPWQPQI